MDVAVLGEIRDGQEVVRALAGDAESFGMRVGAAIPIEETYCHHILEGRLRNIVPDARCESLVKDLALTKLARIGAYIGVPVTTLQAHVYILCCLAHERRPSLSERHVLALRRLAENIARELSAAPTT
jgi:GAF domain-containing protein